MRSRTVAYRLLTPCLALLLVACSSTHLATNPRAEELTDFVLLIREEPDGQVSHSWRRAAEFDLSQYGHLTSMGRRTGRIVLASSRPRDCDQEQIDCVQACMKRRLPSYQNHIKRVDGSKRRFCEKECLDEYMDCLELQKSRGLQFTVVDDAVEWLKRNREQLLVGTIVIIAGVAFVTISAGAGAVVLAPVMLVAG
ncbi:MAG: hypothetical protein ACXU86_05980 [Archangium sp.]